MKARPKGGKVNKAWLHDHINDPYVKLANKEGYRARAAYKLKEIDEQFGLARDVARLQGRRARDRPGAGAAPAAFGGHHRQRAAAQQAPVVVERVVGGKDRVRHAVDQHQLAAARAQGAGAARILVTHIVPLSTIWVRPPISRMSGTQ